MDKGEENWAIRRQAFSECKVKLLGFTWTCLLCCPLRCDPGVSAFGCGGLVSSV